MRPGAVLAHEFVEFIPEDPREGTLYVCIPFATAVHRCCCGCGREVVTPLSPTDWKLTFDGVSVSLHPSIGNWGFPCQSHYWIQHNRVHWAGRWTRDEIEAGRAADAQAKASYYGEEGHVPPSPAREAPVQPAPPAAADRPHAATPERRGWRKLLSWLLGR